MDSSVDETVRALQHLADECDAISRHLKQLASRARQLHKQVTGGKPLEQIMGQEERPPIVTQLTDIVDRLNNAGGAVRRAEAHQLRAEGASQQRIAEIFGVTRQRAAVLLTPDPPDGRRSPYRPAKRQD